MEVLLANVLGQDVSTLAAEEKRLLLSRLLARFAHEVRNPLSSLDIHVQLLEEDLVQASPELRDRTAARFEIIHGEIHRLESLVRHFLSLAGPSSLELEAVDLGRAVGHVCELLRPEAEARGIRLRSEVPEPPPALRADAGQLTQALVNLVVNALQAVEPGGWVEVEAGTAAGAGVSGAGVFLRVRDSGPGIPPERRSTIFDPFFTTKEGGNGLGLWIVQQIVTAHGGTVEASNHAGGGAVFEIRLPSRMEEGEVVRG